MPTYTYQCKKCDHEMDVFHGISAKPRVKCAECGGSCRRLIGPGAGIIFKGSGFYETDYKVKKGKAPETAEKSESKKEGDSSQKDTSTKESKKNESSAEKTSKKD